MCLNPVQIHRRDPVTGSSRIDVVPCGKCVECLKRKQSDYGFLCSREALMSGQVYFLTLTYANENIPMSVVHQTIDKDTGALVDELFAGFVKPEYEQLARDCYYSVYRHSGYSVPCPVSWSPLLPSVAYEKVGTVSGKIYFMNKINIDVRVHRDTENQVTQCFCCPSLRREDVKNWLKSSRMAYKRQFGYFPEFKYFEVGEYGPNTSRPHYHMMFYGIQDEVIRFFAARWYERYGTYDLERVEPRNGDDLKTAYEKVSKYLAKYLCKGEFDSPNSIAKYVERPRRVSSRRLGVESLADIRAYVLGFDLFGEYDPDRPPRKVVDNLPVLLTRRYMPRVNSRGDVVQIKIPSVIYEKCFSKTYGLSPEQIRNMGFSRSDEASAPVRLSHQRTLLRRKITDYVKALAIQSRDDAIRKARSINSSGLSLSAFRQVYDSISSVDRTTRLCAASASRNELFYFYQSSIF